MHSHHGVQHRHVQQLPGVDGVVAASGKHIIHLIAKTCELGWVCQEVVEDAAKRVGGGVRASDDGKLAIGEDGLYSRLLELRTVFVRLKCKLSMG